MSNSERTLIILMSVVGVMMIIISWSIWEWSTESDFQYVETVILLEKAERHWTDWRIMGKILFPSFNSKYYLISSNGTYDVPYSIWNKHKIGSRFEIGVYKQIGRSGTERTVYRIDGEFCTLIKEEIT